MKINKGYRRRFRELVNSKSTLTEYGILYNKLGTPLILKPRVLMKDYIDKHKMSIDKTYYMVRPEVIYDTEKQLNNLRKVVSDIMNEQIEMSRGYSMNLFPSQYARLYAEQINNAKKAQSLIWNRYVADQSRYIP